MWDYQTVQDTDSEEEEVIEETKEEVEEVINSPTAQEETTEEERDQKLEEEIDSPTAQEETTEDEATHTERETQEEKQRADQRPSRTKRKPAKFQTTQEEPYRKAHTLFKKILRSTDAVCFIKHDHKGHLWHTVRVLINESKADLARNHGYYVVEWLVRHKTDSRSKKMKDCRYWQELRRVDNQGRIRERRWIPPAKSRKQIQKLTVQSSRIEINLLETKLVGPFDFETDPNEAGGSRTLGNEYWQQLEVAANQCNLDVTAIHKIVPIQH